MRIFYSCLDKKTLYPGGTVYLDKGRMFFSHRDPMWLWLEGRREKLLFDEHYEEHVIAERNIFIPSRPPLIARWRLNSTSLVETETLGYSIPEEVIIYDDCYLDSPCNTLINQKENVTMTKQFVTEANQNALMHFSRATDYIDLDDPRFTNKIVFERMQRSDYNDSFSERYILNNSSLGAELDEVVSHMPLNETIREQLATDLDHELVDEDLLIHNHKSTKIFRKMVFYRGVMVFFGTIGVDRETLAITVVGNESIAKPFIDFYKDNYTLARRIQYDQLLGFGQQGPNIKSNHLTVEESKRFLGLDVFYPFIEGGIKQLVADYRKSRASVLLLIGARGLGKTALLRALTSELNRDKNVLCDNEAVIQDPRFMEYIQMLDDVTICIEDADNLLKKREDGNFQMSALLNYADGILRNDTQLILSTNLSSMNKVDEALYRPGRCFRVIEFRELTFAEANAARKEIGLEPVDFSEADDYKNKTTISLAGALNWEDAQQGTRFATGVGF